MAKRYCQMCDRWFTNLTATSPWCPQCGDKTVPAGKKLVSRPLVVTEERCRLDACAECGGTFGPIGTCICDVGPDEDRDYDNASER